MSSSITKQGRGTPNQTTLVKRLTRQAQCIYQFSTDFDLQKRGRHQILDATYTSDFQGSSLQNKICYRSDTRTDSQDSPANKRCHRARFTVSTYTRMRRPIPASSIKFSGLLCSPARNEITFPNPYQPNSFIYIYIYIWI